MTALLNYLDVAVRSRMYQDEIDKWYNKTLDISEPLKVPGISSKTFDSNNLFEETIGLVRQAEQSAVGKGLNALREQMSTVQRLESQMKTEVEKAATASGLSLLDKVIQSYTEKVRIAWFSSDFSKDYPNLFKRAREEIDMRSRKILKAVSSEPLRPPQSSPTPREGSIKSNIPGGKPGDQGGDPNEKGTGNILGPPGGKGSAKKQEELGDEMPDVILDFNYQRGNVYVDIMFPKEKQRAGFRLQLQSGIKRNLPSFLAATGIFFDWLESVSKKAEPDQQEINVYVLARVFSGDSVLYSAVYYFRECLIAALQKAGDKRIKIHWYDRLFDEPDDIDKYQGKPILPPDFKKNTMPQLWWT